ncbi:MAG: GIDE domain-containing protein, partial [Rariglobus sp.]
MNDAQIALAVGSLLAAVCLWASLRLRRRQRLLHDLPTSKTLGVFIGMVELKGTAESEAPLTSHLAQCRCALYAWKVEEHWSRTVTSTDSKGRTTTRRESGWKTVATGGDSIPFYLRDEEGVVLIRPEGAKHEMLTVFDETVRPNHSLYYGKGPREAVSNSDHRRRFTESAIPLHAPIYVVGPARERTDVVAPEIAADNEAPLYLISVRT